MVENSRAAPRAPEEKAAMHRTGRRAAGQAPALVTVEREAPVQEVAEEEAVPAGTRQLWPTLATLPR
jgi:hypothetical protein